jgi:magnesium transporter
MGMVIDCAAYEGGLRVASIDFDQAGEAPKGDGQFIWIGLHEPDEELLRNVQRQFGLHDLAIEDAHQAHQRAKLEIYGESLFIVLRTTRLEERHIQFGETHIFAGRGYVVTVRHGSATGYKEVRSRCESAPRMLKMGESFVVYSLMDFVVDNYFPILHEFDTEIDALEETIFGGASGKLEIERIYTLRHELLLMRRAVQPLQEVCARIMRFDVPLIGPEMQPYFRDVQDHVVRVVEGIDNLRDLLNAALETNLLVASIQQNDVTKKLAGWGAILAVPTAVAGIYGMNFKFMPELEMQYAYPIIVAAILGACGLLYWRFKRAGWL